MMRISLRRLLAAALVAFVLVGIDAGVAQAASSSRGTPSRSTILKTSRPAVVLINAYREVGSTTTRTGTLRTFRRVSLGTGFFVTEDGYLLTNKHVVDDLDARYTVNTGDEQVLAEVVHLDATHDIAVLKVAGDDHPALRLGDSSKVSKGDRIIGIGNAEGERIDSVTSGKVTDLSVSLSVISGDGETKLLRRLIRTTARHYRGDSGGPLIDRKGTVVGINAAIGLGKEAKTASYSVPIDLARRALVAAGVRP